MVDIIDEIWPSFAISLVIPEGFADIINVTAPSSALVGETINVGVEVINNGGDDNLFSKIIDTDTEEAVSGLRSFISSGASMLFTHELIMPNKDWNLKVNAGHEE